MTDICIGSDVVVAPPAAVVAGAVLDGAEVEVVAAESSLPPHAAQSSATAAKVRNEVRARFVIGAEAREPGGGAGTTRADRAVVALHDVSSPATRTPSTTRSQGGPR